MRRRTLLAALPTALLAGCTQPDDSDATNRTSTKSARRTATSTALDPAVSFAFDVTITKATPTATRPPTLTVSVQNEDDAPHTLTISNNAFPFATAASSGDGAKLVLDEAIPGDRNGGCWTGHWKKLPMVSGHQFAPGESVSGDYAVLNERDPGTCWPPGRYGFTQTYYLDPKNEDTTTGGSAFDWGFTIQVHDDSSLSIANVQVPHDSTTDS